MPDPLLFLDVDGVLNPAHPDPDDHFDRHQLLGYTVLLSQRHGEWLRELAGHYRLVWATTWEEQANLHIAPRLGLPELPVVRFTGYVPQPDDPEVPLLDLFSGRKWAPIVRYADGRPFAWIDDIIPGSLRRRALPRRDRTLLRVDPGQGLQRRHVDRLLARPPRPALLHRANLLHRADLLRGRAGGPGPG
ncbi:HAD domain-containing protein [Kitasatospora sp. NPDC048540]|uniref:HAD domain-containing protein n=1 Tax=unclassified Kitasatospora TaxID=2633591 RepID=UPI000A7A213D|nr:HAD domain-containing protein [Kitasatospora sp. MBT63]